MFAFFYLLLYNLNMTEKQKELNLKLDAMLEFIKEYTIKYVGKEIDDDFIVGYGLDYAGKGRKYSQIYNINE